MNRRITSGGIRNRSGIVYRVTARRNLATEKGGVSMMIVQLMRTEKVRVKMRPLRWKKGRTARPFSGPGCRV